MARYKVIGAHEVLGHEPGEEFDANLDTITEARLIWGGHLERLDASGTGAGSRRPVKKDEKAKDAPADDDSNDEPDADAAA